MKSSYPCPNYKDPRWQKKRLEVLKKAEWKCEICGEDKKTLNVHHRYYVSHRMLWEYPDFCFQSLCEECHEGEKTNVQEMRDDNKARNVNAWSDWEEGLNYYGEGIFFTAVDDMASKTCRKAAQ